MDYNPSLEERPRKGMKTHGTLRTMVTFPVLHGVGNGLVARRVPIETNSQPPSKL